MTQVIFRSDASLAIGSGHIMRCRTLARELRSRGADIIFICRNQIGDLIQLLEQEFQVLILPKLALPPCEQLEGRSLYKAWLGCSHQEDANQCIDALFEAGINHASWLVVDHYGLDSFWELQLLKGLSCNDVLPKILVIDDLADRHHIADLLLDQNFFAEETSKRYKELVPTHCLQLLGPHYALLGSEYSSLHRLVPDRFDIKRILVFFGGVDQFNLTGLTLTALSDSALIHLAVDVVVGVQSPHRQNVEQLVSNRPLTTLYDSLPSLAGLISRADLSIGAGGATTWERACLRLPSLVVAIASNQLPFVQALDQAGYLQLLGTGSSVTSEQILSALHARVVDPLTADSGYRLTDGWGASRVALAMLGPKGAISLRSAKASDEALVLRWSSDIFAPYNSPLAQAVISDEQHNWFGENLEKSTKLTLIAEQSDGCPIGIAHFELQYQVEQSTSSNAVLELFLDPTTNDHGLRLELVRLSFEALEQYRGALSAKSVVDFSTDNSISTCFIRSDFPLENCSEFLPIDSAAESLQPSRITVLSDGGSWVNANLAELISALWQRGHYVRWIHDPAHLKCGDVCLLLSCGRLLSEEQLLFHRHNLVVHASALPLGQGWSPMTWQILEGLNSIPLTLFEATAELDAGCIYLQTNIELKGHELVDDWRALLNSATHKICLDWFDSYLKVLEGAQPQQGEGSFYGRRRPADSRLDVKLSIDEQFNVLRVVDNQRYPAYFEINGKEFRLNISKLPDRQ